MSNSFMQEVLVITDRFIGRKDPDAVDRQGQLPQVMVVVIIFHVIMGISFVKMEEYEHKHPRIIRDVDVCFEFQAPPPAPEFKVGEVPRAIALTDGQNPSAGSAASARPRAADETVTLPTPKERETQEVPVQEAAKPLVSRSVTQAPPVMVNQMQAAKAEPLQSPKTSNKMRENPSDMAGAYSQAMASGGPRAGGGPTDSEGGVGTGGTGAGGAGTGDGDAGNDSGLGTIGGEKITLRQPLGGQVAKGDVSRYRRDLLMRIAAAWHPKHKTESLTVQLRIARDGQLLGAEIIESSGNKRADKEAQAAVEAMDFAPLPDWYKGEYLTFNIDLAKVEQTP